MSLHHFCMDVVINFSQTQLMRQSYSVLLIKRAVSKKATKCKPRHGRLSCALENTFKRNKAKQTNKQTNKQTVCFIFSFKHIVGLFEVDSFRFSRRMKRLSGGRCYIVIRT